MSRCARLRALTALGIIKQQGRADEGEHAVRITVERMELDLGLGAAVFQRNRAGVGVGGCLHDRAIQRPVAQYRPEPAISSVGVLRNDRHRGALRATTSGLAKEDVFRKHHKAHLLQITSR